MRILAVVSKNEVRRDRLLQLFENGFHLGTRERQEAIRELLQQCALQPLAAGERFSPALRLSFPVSDGAEHHPVKCAAGILFDQAEDSPSTTNLDIIGMRAQA